MGDGAVLEPRARAAYGARGRSGHYRREEVEGPLQKRLCALEAAGQAERIVAAALVDEELEVGLAAPQPLRHLDQLFRFSYRHDRVVSPVVNL